MENNNEEMQSINSVEETNINEEISNAEENIDSNVDDKNNKSVNRGFILGRDLYRAPVRMEKITDSQCSRLYDAIVDHLDYHEGCRARGRVKAGQHRTMGPYPFGERE